MKTGYFYDTRMLDHVLEPGHPESPARLRAIDKEITTSALDTRVVRLQPYDDPMPFIQLNHTKEHIRRIQAIPVTGKIAEVAVAGVIGAVKAVHEGDIDNAFCAVRPPGHHVCNSGYEEGFCFYNNIAIAAKYALSGLGYERILIIDWDYHHGNGTEYSFYNDPKVLYFSTHCLYSYPGTGYPSHAGSGDGAGFNINIPLLPGAVDTKVIRAWEDHLLPAAEAYRPELILISAGFDSRNDDPLGSFDFTDDGFYRLTKMAKDLAARYCGNRLVSVLEGGYDVQGSASAVITHLTALLEEPPGYIQRFTPLFL